jgi:hypothetical protein
MRLIRKIPMLWVCMAAIIAGICGVGCSRFHKNAAHRDVPDSSIAAGKELAVRYCQSCHVLPEPSQLDAGSWAKGVLPNMGPHLGIFNYKWERYPSARYSKDVPSSFYPSQPLLNNEEWQDIIDYYTALAPDVLPGKDRRVAIENRPDLFAVSRPSVRQGLASTCYIKVDTMGNGNGHTILAADVLSKKIFRYDAGLDAVDSMVAASPVVDIDFSGGRMTACGIGVLNPNNGRFGKLEDIIVDVAGKMGVDTSFTIDQLQRPVQSIKVDLNQDGRDDRVVCEFGYLTGALSWYENLGNGKFTRHVLRAVPGAIKAYVTDYNHDGLPDLIVLFAQADEGIFLFTNKGGGRFEEKALLRFPPSYGSSYFELDDFNHDGFPDILYTCGDNADFSPVLKPYHGVYIFMNDGHYNFTQKYFFPINGCYKAIARDFDGDGDLDIATIAFFADYTRQPEEGFVYLENEGGLSFRPYSLSQTQAGRWLTMDAGDLDGNGKPCIVLGNFALGARKGAMGDNWKKGPGFLVLRNNRVLVKR